MATGQSIETTIGQRIGLYLDENGIMKSYVANKAGIAYQRFYEITWGKRKIGAVEYINVCKVLKKDPNFFMDDDVKEEECVNV